MSTHKTKPEPVLFRKLWEDFAAARIRTTDARTRRQMEFLYYAGATAAFSLIWNAAMGPNAQEVSSVVIEQIEKELREFGTKHGNKTLPVDPLQTH